MSSDKAKDVTAPVGSYTVEKQYEGLYYVIDWEGDRAASVGRFMPGPMVHVQSSTIHPPALARAIATAMTMLADELEDVNADA